MHSWRRNDGTRRSVATRQMVNEGSIDDVPAELRAFDRCGLGYQRKEAVRSGPTAWVPAIDDGFELTSYSGRWQLAVLLRQRAQRSAGRGVKN